MSEVRSSAQSVAEHVSQVDLDLAEFRKKFSIAFIVSISGSAEDHHGDNVETTIAELTDGLKDSSCAILTGGTQGGIPEVGVKMARANNIPTIAVFPANAKKYVLFDSVDLPIQTLEPSVGKATFGTETPSFAQLPDYAVYIGGGYGTLAEVSTMLKINAGRKKHQEEPIYIIPIAGSDGVASIIPMLVNLAPNLSFCLPQFQISTGKEAAKFITNRQMSKQLQ